MTEDFLKTDNEIIFSNTNFNSPDNDDDLVSDKVHILANGIYQEFENLIKVYGQGTVDGLMPLVVTILETMDKLYTCKDDLSLQLDLMKEDQCQLYTQYEREKLSRKLAEEKINRIEDQFEEERQQFENRIEILESSNKLHDRKIQNCRDLISRHEEREVEMRKEFTNLQQRYSELLRSKADHKQRNINSQCTADEISSGCQSPQLLVKHKFLKIIQNVGNQSQEMVEISNNDESNVKMEEMEIHVGRDINELSLKEEIGQDWNSENPPAQEYPAQKIPDINAMLEFDINEECCDQTTHTEAEINTDNEETGLENDYDDLDMSKEIAFLLKENQELIETKDALNVVKDDLITKVDELTGELFVIQDELRTANLLKMKYKTQFQELEKRFNDVSQKLQEKESKLSELGEDDSLIECAVDQNGIQTKTKFTRAEVARILSERNKYKEDLLELQETMKYQMSIMKQTNGKAKKGSMWNFFSNVFSNATAFTTEAIIGSGNEMEVAQLNRNFQSHHKDEAITLRDESGATITLPNLSNQSIAFRKRPNPGLPIRVSNPLFNTIDENSHTMVNLVPIDEVDRQFKLHNAIDNSSV